MSKKILVFAVLFSLVLSISITQEASALTNWPGQYSRTTASLGPSKVCGNQICEPGENSKWAHAVQASQSEGHGKATGGLYGHVIMHQLFVNSLVKNSHMNSAMVPSRANVNATGSK